MKAMFGVLLGAFFVAVGFAPIGRAQDAGVSGVAVIRPTDNSFDELLQAGAASLEDPSTDTGKAITDAESSTATLTQRLAAMREPAFRSAMATFRDAIARPIELPLVKGKDITRFAPAVERLARLLAIEQYVLLSEGKTPAAIASLADSLTLADTVQRWSLPGVRTGEYVEDTAVRTLAPHLDELSERDCLHLLSLLKENLSRSAPAIDGMRAEGRVVAWNLAEFLNGELPGEKETVVPPAASDADTWTTQVLRIKKQDPVAWAALKELLARRLTDDADAMADRMAVYPSSSTPKPTETAQTQSSLSLLAGKLLSSLGQTSDQYYENSWIDQAVVSRTHLQLLAVHAAILLSRWDTNTTPDDLTALKLRSLGVDPFTGQSLLYTRLDPTHYTLASAGPQKRDHDGNIVASAIREPIFLSFPDPKR